MLTPVFENGILHRLDSRPPEHCETKTGTISDSSHDLLAHMIDYEFLEAAKREVEAAGYIPTREEVRRILSRDKTSWADIIIAERRDRL